MKKLLSILAVALFLTMAMQTAHAQKMWIGPRAGLNLANLSFDSTLPSGETKSMKAGLIAGGQFDIWFDDMFGLGIGLLYDQKGDKQSVDQNDNGYVNKSDQTNALNYLEIPITLNVAFGTGDVKPFVFAGPSIGIPMAANSSLKGSSSYSLAGQTISQSYDTTFDVKDSLASVDFSIVAGAGVMIKMTGMALIFDAGYAIGFSDINKNEQRGGAVKTNDIRITAALMFPLD